MLNQDTVRNVANLCRLDLSDTDVRRFTGDLDKILVYFEQLNEVDTSGVQALTHVHEYKNVLRKDEPRTSLGAAIATDNAPDRDGPSFRVPKVLDQSDA